MALDVFFYLVRKEDLNDFHSRSQGAFSDRSRCSATIDHLLNNYLQANTIPGAENMIWHGGTTQSLSQDEPGETAVYGNDEIARIAVLLNRVDTAALQAMYSYEELLAEGVYKATRPDQLPFLVQTYDQLKEFFARAHREQLMIVRQIV